MGLYLVFMYMITIVYFFWIFLFEEGTTVYNNILSSCGIIN